MGKEMWMIAILTFQASPAMGSLAMTRQVEPENPSAETKPSLAGSVDQTQDDAEDKEETSTWPVLGWGFCLHPEDKPGFLNGAAKSTQAECEKGCLDDEKCGAYCSGEGMLGEWDCLRYTSCTDTGSVLHGNTMLHTCYQKPVEKETCSWYKKHKGKWCKNRIKIADGLSDDECRATVLNDDKCENVMYTNGQNNDCFCVPKGESCKTVNNRHTDIFMAWCEPTCTWSKKSKGKWCKNRIEIADNLSDEECRARVLADDSCEKVTYNHKKHDKCFCLPKGETCLRWNNGNTDLWECA